MFKKISFSEDFRDVQQKKYRKSPSNLRRAKKLITKDKDLRIHGIFLSTSRFLGLKEWIAFEMTIETDVRSCS